MNRLEIETNLIQSLRELPDDKLVELFDLELERDQTLCRNIDL